MKSGLLFGIWVFIFLSLFSFHFTEKASAACPGCNDETACTDANCKGCYEGFCFDCCSFNGEEGGDVECQLTPGCHLVGSECRNNPNHDCSVPEVPTQSRWWILTGFMVLGGVLAGFFKWKRSQRPVV